VTPHEPPRLADALPSVATALEQSLRDEGELGLARSLANARVYALCECSQHDCMSFYLSPPLDGPCPGDYRVVMPRAVMTVAVCDETIGWVQDEALDMDDAEVRARLREFRALEGIVPRHRPPM
jgi:hypothetical protein